MFMRNPMYWSVTTREITEHNKLNYKEYVAVLLGRTSISSFKTQRYMCGYC